MYTVTKIFHIAAAHRLMHYTGPCRFVHGHDFVITFTPLGGIFGDIAIACMSAISFDTGSGNTHCMSYV